MKYIGKYLINGRFYIIRKNLVFNFIKDVELRICKIKFLLVNIIGFFINIKKICIFELVFYIFFKRVEKVLVDIYMEIRFYEIYIFFLV